jgi:NAD(P)-dependent dehydrogenase (short-subunit alcohol dehydrogenase family)
MKNQWQLKNNNSKSTDNDLLFYLRKLLDSEPGIILIDIGGLGIKTKMVDPLQEQRPALLINSNASIIYLDLEFLRRISELEITSHTRLKTALGFTRLDFNAIIPPMSTVYHAVLPGKASIFLLPSAMVALDLLEDPSSQFENTFGNKLTWINTISGLALAKQLQQIACSDATGAIFVHRVGLFVFADGVKAAYDLLIDLVNQAESKLNNFYIHFCSELDQNTVESPVRESIAVLRNKLSTAVGAPLLVNVTSNQTLLSMLNKVKLQDVLLSGPLLKAQADRFAHGLLKANTLPESLPTNNALIVENLGLAVTGATATDLAHNVKFICLLLEATNTAWNTGKMSAESGKAGELVPVSAYDDHDKSHMFAGEIAMVTGAASGIGRGCALSLLERGAVVIGLDVDPKIEVLFDSPAYLGLVCNITNADMVQSAIETAARRFGGLDMVVLNAGIFAKSELIKELELETWQRVMRINLDANVTVMREAYTLLKEAPKNGRVLVNASRNVTAPGIGAAAYSTSKAGLTQLARVAALEWGKDGIRVNIIHPDAVFDTSIWTDEMIKGRAKKYGISVKEYKTRNILKTELTSHDIGELVCELLGPVFSKTTGAQVPVDGGSDRVI